MGKEPQKNIFNTRELFLLPYLVFFLKIRYNLSEIISECLCRFKEKSTYQFIFNSSMLLVVMNIFFGQ